MSTTQAVSRATRETVAERAERLQSALVERPRGVFLLFTSLFFATATLLSAIKVFWFDELITVYIIRPHSLRVIWQALLAGVDQNPPLNHIVTLPLHWLFGDDMIAMRFPAMFAFWIAMLAMFQFIRRRVPATMAAGAVLFVFATRAFDYSFDARPYGLLMASGMVALLAWQYVAEGRNRRLALVALTFALAAGVSSHYYAVLVFVPIAAGEVVRTFRRGRIDYEVWLAQLLGGLPLVAYLPLIRTDMRLYTDYAWNRPRPEFLWNGYYTLLEETIWPVMVIFAAALLFWFIRRHKDDELIVPAHEFAAIVSLVGLPVVAYALAVLKTGQMSARYVLPATFGVAITLAIAISKLGRRKAIVGFVFVLVAFCWFGVRTMLMASELLERREQFNTFLQQPALKGTLPILCADSQATLALTYYAGSQFTSRLTLPLDFDSVREFQKEDSAEQTLYAGRDVVFPIREEALRNFRGGHSTYLVLDNEQGWLFKKLSRDGVKLRLAMAQEKFYNGQVDPLFRMRPQLWMAEEQVGSHDVESDWKSSAH